MPRCGIPTNFCTVAYVTMKRNANRCPSGCFDYAMPAVMMAIL